MDEIVQGGTLLAEPKTSRETNTMPIRKIGIVGAGQMGSGIAHVVALSGYQAVINDLERDRFDAAIKAIDKNLARQVASGKINEEDRKQTLSRISFAETFSGFGDADLVIEAATEDESV